MSKTYNEKITSIEEQIQQLENRRKQLVQQQREQERKARTKRLIERGAILESLIPEAETFTNEQIQTLLQRTVTTGFATNILKNVKAQRDVTMDGKTRDAKGAES